MSLIVLHTALSMSKPAASGAVFHHVSSTWPVSGSNSSLSIAVSDTWGGALMQLCNDLHTFPLHQNVMRLVFP